MAHDDPQTTHVNVTEGVPSPAVELIDAGPAVEDFERIMTEKREQRELLLRTAADLDNLRKRTKRDIADAERQGREAVIKDLVPVLDNLERALRHAEPGPMTTGVRLVEKELLGTLEKHSLTKFSALRGALFDPSVHHAIDRRETADLEPGVIAEEFAAGYVHGNRLLRPALVAVAKAPTTVLSPDLDSDETDNA